MKTKNNSLIVAPSLLAADFSMLHNAMSTIQNAEADWVHLDVMDGHFVPNLTFGPKLINDLRKHSQKIFDTHLMVSNPDLLLEDYIHAGSDIISIHYEAVTHVHRTLQRIKSFGAKAGISIVPSTAVSTLDAILPFVDLVLVMTVNPGFGGQTMIDSCVQKIHQLYSKRKEHNYSYLISVDGGVNRDTAKSVVNAGADIIVAGSAFFKSQDPAEEVRFFKNLKQN